MLATCDFHFRSLFSLGKRHNVHWFSLKNSTLNTSLAPRITFIVKNLGLIGIFWVEKASHFLPQKAKWRLLSSKFCLRCQRCRRIRKRCLERGKVQSSHKLFPPPMLELSNWISPIGVFVPFCKLLVLWCKTWKLVVFTGKKRLEKYADYWGYQEGVSTALVGVE